jgi:hypothetical protein
VPQTADVHDLICGAIRGRVPIDADYGGHRRQLCPHAIGTKDGSVHVMCWQSGGGSRGGLPDGGDWRCLRLAGLSDVRLRPGAAWRGDRLDRATQHCIDVIELAADG